MFDHSVIPAVPCGRGRFAGRTCELPLGRFQRFTGLFAVVAVLVMPPLVSASTVTLTDYNLGNADFANNIAGGGGPFAARTTGATLGMSEFVTFCLEFTEYFSLGGTYDFTLSDNAVNGGVAGGNPDPLSDATKWLYAHVASDAYSSVYTDATGLGLSNNVGAHIQAAIWYLEQERTASEIGGPTSAGYRLATYAVANQNWSALFAAGHRVYAINLTDAAGGFYQDQLAYQTAAPVPEPSAMLLLGFGLLYVGGKLRRKTQPAK